MTRIEKSAAFVILCVSLIGCAKTRTSGVATQPVSQGALQPGQPAAVPPASSPPGDLPETYSPEPSAEWYARFGKCLLSPNSQQYAKLWSQYDADIERKVTLNIPALASFKIPQSISDFVAALLAVRPVLLGLDQIKDSDWMKKLYAQPGFIEFTSSAAFLAVVEDPSFTSLNKDPDFIRDYQGQPPFKSSIDQMAADVASPIVKQAIVYFHQKNLSFISPDGLASALALANFFASTGNLSSIAYVKDLPWPTNPPKPDYFGQSYTDVVDSAITGFLTDNPVTPGPGLDQSTADALNHISSPVTSTAYDDYVVASHLKDPDDNLAASVFGKDYRLTPDQVSAIDGVARTFWGEERGCEEEGYAQYELVGIVIANRAMAVQNALDEQVQVDTENLQVDQQDVQLLLGTDPEKGFDSFVGNRQMGLIDFGIADSSLPVAAQVVSKPEQFSVWNSYSTASKRLSQLSKALPKGIPDVTLKFNVPDSAVDQLALIHVLCPQIPQNVSTSKNQLGWPNASSFSPKAGADWKRAVDLASLVVADPQRYKEVFETAPKPSSPLMYYTDGINLSDTVRQSLNGIVYTDPASEKSVTLKVVPSSGECSSLRVFSPTPGTVYGVSP